LSQWAANPIAWRLVDIAAAVPITLGIVLQGKAFADLLSTRSLHARNYNRARTLFLAGLGMVAAGIAIALMLDVVGYGPRTLAP
jgi:hypothetical protein